MTYGIKQLQFSWPAVADATSYKLMERPAATGDFVQVGADLATTNVNHEIALHQRVNAAYRIDSCNNVGCTASNLVGLAAQLVPAVGYFKASNMEAADRFGAAIAISGDGNTLAVSAPGEDGNTTGADGNQADNTAAAAGAVYVFARTGGTWAQQSYLKASNTEAGDDFGFALALSADGNTLAVSADAEASGANGIGGNQADNTSVSAGAVYVFFRTAANWSQQAYIKASNSESADFFGSGVALSGDGNTLAVGAPGEDSSAVGVAGNEADNTTAASGAAYVFIRTAGMWSQQAYIKASNTGASDRFGLAVALSGDGNTLAVGTVDESSSAVGIGGNQNDNSAPNAGAVYVFARTAAMWSQQAYVKASNSGSSDEFGTSLALSGDGNTLAVGAVGEQSNAIGIGGNQLDNSSSGAGAVYVFVRTGSVWTQQAYIKASNNVAGHAFGATVALSADGNSLAVSGPGEDSNATGVGGNQSTVTANGAGAAYTFARVAGVWTQQSYVKASNTGPGDAFGGAIALSGNGATLVVAAVGEDSNATGIGGSQSNNAAITAGAVYMY